MKKNKITRILFFLYFMLLIWLVVFKLNFSISDIHKVRDINLIPFHYENVMEGDIPLFEALLNVIVFVPFGFLLHKAFYWKFLKEILLIAGISFAFEVTQYVLAIGVTDITDFITNILGGIIGIGLSILLLKRKNKV